MLMAYDAHVCINRREELTHSPSLPLSRFFSARATTMMFGYNVLTTFRDTEMILRRYEGERGKEGEGEGEREGEEGTEGERGRKGGRKGVSGSSSSPCLWCSS